jgi:hypothetical protein
MSRAVAAREVVRLGRGLVAAALCAQVTHAVVYGSLVPSSGEHGYLRWYTPLLVALSVGALALVPVSIAAGALARRRVSVAALLPAREAGEGLRDAARLAVTSAVVLLLQESIERSAASGALHIATFSPFTLLVAALVLVVAAGAVVALERTLDALAGSPESGRAPRGSTSAPWAAKTARRGRTRPLSSHAALRAPPLAV